MKRHYILLAAATLLLSACGTTRTDRAASGAAIGAATGVVLGAFAAAPVTGGAIGAVAGGVLGAATPDSMSWGRAWWE